MSQVGGMFFFQASIVTWARSSCPDASLCSESSCSSTMFVSSASIDSDEGDLLGSLMVPLRASMTSRVLHVDVESNGDIMMREKS